MNYFSGLFVGRWNIKAASMCGYWQYIFRKNYGNIEFSPKYRGCAIVRHMKRGGHCHCHFRSRALYQIGKSTCGLHCGGFRLLTCKILSASINSALTHFSLKHLMVGIEEYVLSNIKHRFAEKGRSTILFRFHAVATLEKL